MTLFFSYRKIEAAKRECVYKKKNKNKKKRDGKTIEKYGEKNMRVFNGLE